MNAADSVRRIILLSRFPWWAAGIGLWAIVFTGPAFGSQENEVRLMAADAKIHGGAKYYASGEFIGGWLDRNATLEWTLDVQEPGYPNVELLYSCAPGCGGHFELTVGDKKLTGRTQPTGDWYAYRPLKLGSVELAKGPCKVILKAGPFKTAPMNVKYIQISPLKARVQTNRPIPTRAIHIVPNFHPASCGWLANFSVERNYCANSYLDHLDRVRDDLNYAFALSEVNNLIAIQNFEPRRFDELKSRVKEGRVELVNAFFLEPTINLSGGEALVKMGVEGLRWQQQVMGVRPRFAWTIDVCGTHDQMAQICSGLGLDAMVYTRNNPTGKTIHWAQSPDGSRILALSPGHYSELGLLFKTTQTLTDTQIERSVAGAIAGKEHVTPEGAPILILGGSGDYALSPARKEYPSEFLQQWKRLYPRTDLRFATAGQYLDAVLPGIRSGQIQIPTMLGGTGYQFDSFWIQCPKVKSLYRTCEHQLQAAETLATIASLKANFKYPAQSLYEAWLLMLLNMDRNTLWGAAGGMVFETDKSWDARDRFDFVAKISGGTLESASRAVVGQGQALALFSSLNWKRNDPIPLQLPKGKSPAAVVCQTIPLFSDDEATICQMEIPSIGIATADFGSRPPAASQAVALPDLIETTFYTARIDSKTGALVSLKVKPSGREMLGGPANVVVAEKPKKQQGDPGDHMLPRPQRDRLAASSDFKPTITVQTGPLATVVAVESEFFGGGLCRRVMRFYNNYPRIDFDTELNDTPDRTVVVAEFPLADEITEVRRGIPYGFSHGAWTKANLALHGWTKGITPAVRWSHYALAGGGGVAILDRGLTGRELNDKIPILYLLNASDKYYGYPNAWLSGRGKHRLAYALITHEGEWAKARIPQLAWEFNCPPVAGSGGTTAAVGSFVQTSDNVIVEVLRREGSEIELRMAECLGTTGTAEVTLNLPHAGAALTDLVGGHAKALSGGPTYRFPIRPQQIVTMRFHTDSAVEEVKPLMEWDDLVPEAKRAALNVHTRQKGHPPRGN